MRVTILGAGTAIPAKRHSPAGLYVRVANEHILLDAGPGTLQRLYAAGAPYQHLDRIFLTHFHIDHCLDLVSILFALRLPAPREGRSRVSARLPAPARFASQSEAAGAQAGQAGIPQLRRRKPLAVYGPLGLKRLYTRLNTAFHGWLTPRGFRVTFTELAEAAIRLPGYTVRTQRMNHYATKAVGYRLTAGGKSLAYSGDTDVCDGIVRLGQGTEVLILECSVPDERKVDGHLTPSECGRIAAQAGCRHLVLTHFYPVFQGYDVRAGVRRFFRGRLTLAHDSTALSL